MRAFGIKTDWIQEISTLSHRIKLKSQEALIKKQPANHQQTSYLSVLKPKQNLRKHLYICRRWRNYVKLNFKLKGIWKGDNNSKTKQKKGNTELQLKKKEKKKREYSYISCKLKRNTYFLLFQKASTKILLYLIATGQTVQPSSNAP